MWGISQIRESRLPEISYGTVKAHELIDEAPDWGDCILYLYPSQNHNSSEPKVQPDYQTRGLVIRTTYIPKQD